jgi:protein gp37
MSKIEWTEKTWNPVKARNLETGKVGNYCEKISAGCKHCYAEAINHRGMEPSGNGLFYIVENRPKVEIFLNEDILMQPLQRRKPTTYFPGSMTDLFGDWVTDEMLDRIFAVMALCPQHTFQVLTKRARRMREYLNTPFVCNRIFDQMRAITPDRGVWCWDGMEQMFRHIQLGVSCENQEQADKRIPDLIQTPAAVRFLSCEPLLGPVTADLTGIDWLIIGGESGPGARPCEVPWVESLVKQCAEANVACFVKQLGAYAVAPADKGLRFRFTGDGIEKWGKGADMDRWPLGLRVRQMPGDLRQTSDKTPLTR